MYFCVCLLLNPELADFWLGWLANELRGSDCPLPPQSWGQKHDLLYSVPHLPHNKLFPQPFFFLPLSISYSYVTQADLELTTQSTLI